MIPLCKARLCLNCDCLFEERACPLCASEIYIAVSRIIQPLLDVREIRSNDAHIGHVGVE